MLDNIKAWIQLMIETDLCVGDTVELHHNWPNGCRVNSGVGVVTNITYDASLQQFAPDGTVSPTHIKVKYRVGSESVVVAPKGLHLVDVNAPKRRRHNAPENDEASAAPQAEDNDRQLGSALVALGAQNRRAASAARDASAAKKAKHDATSEVAKQTTLRVVAESRLCHGLADAAAQVKAAKPRQEQAETAQRAATDAREAERSRAQSALCKKREEIKSLKQRLNDEQAALARMESEATFLAISTTTSRDAEAAARQAAEEEAAAQRAVAEQALAACAQFDDKTLSSLLRYLAPGDGPARERADAILKVRSLDALSSSDAAVVEGTRTQINYKRSVVVSVEGLLSLAANGDSDRIHLLEDAVHGWLEQQRRRRRAPPEVGHWRPFLYHSNFTLKLDLFLPPRVAGATTPTCRANYRSDRPNVAQCQKKCATISVRCRH